MTTNPLARVDGQFQEPHSDSEIAVAAAHVLGVDVVPAEAVIATVAKGWVTLWGEVGHDHQRQESERAIGRLPGVGGVTNRIRVRGPE